MSLLKTLLPLLLLTVLVSGQVKFTGRCPQPPVMTDFIRFRSDYLHRWYVQAEYPIQSLPDVICKRVDYETHTEDGGFHFVEQGYIRKPDEGDVYYFLIGDLVPVFNSTEARFTKHYDGTQSLAEGRLSGYKILRAEWDFSIVWDCKDMSDGNNVQEMFILTKEKYPGEELMEKIISMVVTNFTLDAQNLQQVEQPTDETKSACTM